ncbi:MAG TPA: transposase [Terriglobales bacterium]|nr:transposase [Terriglobales bacterium]
MKISLREQLVQFSNVLQAGLFDRLEQELGPLSEKAQRLVSVLAMVSLSRWITPRRGWRGRPCRDRQAVGAAFLAKAIYGLETTRQVLERLQTDRQLRCLCGWNEVRQIPHESTFSRAFAEFAGSELPQRLHEALIEATQKDRLVGHIARDSTAIEARERYPENPPPKPQRKRYKMGPKPKRGTPRSPRSRIEAQRSMQVSDMLAELPRHCSLGVKKSSKGHLNYWRGYKLHLDVADGQIPITAVLTGACVHDSQVAVPLMTMTSQRVTYLYELMDAAYDAHAIREHSEALGHRPITELVRRHRVTRTKVPPRKDSHAKKTMVTCEPIHRELTWAEQDRMRERTMVERVYSRLKDEFGGRSIRVRGASKIMAHLMFGVLALTVDQLLRLTG